MYINCPTCSTLYRITAEQLEAAGGMAHCTRCNQAFKAQENQWGHLSIQATPGGDPSEMASAQRTTSPDGDTDADTAETTLLVADTVDTQAIAALSGTAPPPSPRAHPPGPVTDGAVPHPGVPEEVSTPASLIEQISQRQRRSGGAWWLLGTLGLLLLLLGQLAWFQQDVLLRNPQTRALAEGVCAQTGCRLPPLRDPQQIQILKREIKSHPEIQGALKLELVMFNAALFAQSYPVLELSLLDSNQRVVVRRRFSPAEYLGSQAAADAPMRPRRAQYIEMELEDPGNVSGFRFDFL